MDWQIVLAIAIMMLAMVGGGNLIRGKYDAATACATVAILLHLILTNG